MKKEKIYDVIIIGAGPAGLTAALYAARYKLNALIFGSETESALWLAHKVENYPGFDEISGPDLLKKMAEQVKKIGVEIKNEKVNKIIKEKQNFIVFSDKNERYEAKTLILALGTERQKLELPKADKFLGKGLSYCATCDARFFKGKEVCVIGGSNAAAMAALLLSEYAKKVFIIYRKAELRAEPIYVERIKKNKKIEIIYNSNIKEIIGEEKIEAIVLDNGKKIELQGIFVEIGSVPNEVLLKPLGVKTDNGIIANEKMETNVHGIYAAGDVIKKQLRQIVTAENDGAIAAFNVFSYVKSKSR